MTKSELLSVTCQLSHELKEWKDSQNPSHYDDAMTLLYRIQSGLTGIKELKVKQDA